MDTFRGDLETAKVYIDSLEKHIEKLDKEKALLILEKEALLNARKQDRKEV